MHAASVNPEPGSNSLKNSISNRLLPAKHLFQSYICLSFFFYFVMSFSKLFSRFLRTFSAFKKFHCCSIFKDQFCPVFQPVFRASTWQLTYYTLIVYNCQYLFWNFFRFFWTFLALEIFGYTLYAIYINAGFKRRFALLISTVKALSPLSLRAHTYIKRMIFTVRK